MGQPALDPVRLDRPRLDLGRLGLQVLELDEPPAVDRAGQRRDEVLLGAGLRRRGLREVELAERLLELRAHAVERRARAGGDHRPDELEREPDRARLERRQPRRPAERVAEELLVDVHLVAVQLRVDGVAAAAEVDEVEQREVLLERLGAGSRSARSARAAGITASRSSPQAASR